MGTVDEERKILSINAAFDSIIEEYQNGNSSRAIGNTFISMGVCIPSSIKVKLTDEIISTVDFKTYCKRVAAREVGYDSYDSDYHKSGCIALKTYALYRILTANSDLGYHIEAVEATAQIYDPSVNYNDWPNLMAAMDATWNIFLMDGQGNCIAAQYRSGTKQSHLAYDYQGSGIMIQSTAITMAASNTYTDILTYFYSNSFTTNYTVLQFKTLAHNYVSLIDGRRRCLICGHTIQNVAP